MGAGADVSLPGTHARSRGRMRPASLLLQREFKRAPQTSPSRFEKAFRSSVDSLDELRQLNAAAGEAGKKRRYRLPRQPGHRRPTHQRSRTGLATSQVRHSGGGDPGRLPHALAADISNPVGIHCHIGSQILDVEPSPVRFEVLIGVTRDSSISGSISRFIDIGAVSAPYRRETDRARHRRLRGSGHAVSSTASTTRDRARTLGRAGQGLVADSTVLALRGLNPFFIDILARESHPDNSARRLHNGKGHLSVGCLQFPGSVACDSKGATSMQVLPNPAQVEPWGSAAATRRWASLPAGRYAGQTRWRYASFSWISTLIWSGQSELDEGVAGNPLTMYAGPSYFQQGEGLFRFQTSERTCDHRRASKGTQQTTSTRQVNTGCHTYQNPFAY